MRRHVERHWGPAAWMLLGVVGMATTGSALWAVGLSLGGMGVSFLLSRPSRHGDDVEAAFAELERRSNDVMDPTRAAILFAAYDRELAVVRKRFGAASPAVALALVLSMWTRVRKWDSAGAKKRVPELIELLPVAATALIARAVGLLAALDDPEAPSHFDAAWRALQHAPSRRAALACAYAEAMADDHPENARALLQRALAELDGTDDAGQPYRRDAEATPDPALVQVRVLLGTLWTRAGDFAAAWEAVRPLDAVLDPTTADWDPELVTFRYNAGECYEACRQQLAAMRAASTDEQRLRRARDLVSLLVDVGALEAAQRIRKEAPNGSSGADERMRRELDAIVDARVLPVAVDLDDERLAAELRAVAASGRGKHAKAERLAREALVKAIAAHGATHPFVCDPLLTLTEVLVVAGDTNGARVALQQAIDLEARFGPDHPQMVRLLELKQRIAPDPEIAGRAARLRDLHRLDEIDRLGSE